MVLFQKKRNIEIIFDIFIYFAHTKFDVSVLARITFYYFFFFSKRRAVCRILPTANQKGTKARLKWSHTEVYLRCHVNCFS